MVKQGKVDVCAQAPQVPVRGDGGAPRVDDVVVCGLYQPERRARDGRDLGFRSKVVVPRGAHGNARGKQVRVICQQAARHEPAVREPTHVHARGVGGRQRRDRATHHVAKRSHIAALVIVLHLSGARVHPVCGRRRRQHVRRATELCLDVRLPQRRHPVCHDRQKRHARLPRTMQPQQQRHGPWLRRMAVPRALWRKEREAHVAPIEVAFAREVPSTQVGAGVTCRFVKHETLEQRLIPHARKRTALCHVKHGDELPRAHDTAAYATGRLHLRKLERHVAATGAARGLLVTRPRAEHANVRPIHTYAKGICKVFGIHNVTRQVKHELAHERTHVRCGRDGSIRCHGASKAFRKTHARRLQGGVATMFARSSRPRDEKRRPSEPKADASSGGLTCSSFARRRTRQACAYLATA